MKKILLLIAIILLLIPAMPGSAADKPVSQLTEATTIAAEDLLMISYYSGGNYYSRKLTFANLVATLSTYYLPIESPITGDQILKTNAAGDAVVSGGAQVTGFANVTTGKPVCKSGDYTIADCSPAATITIAAGALALATSEIAAGACQAVSAGSVNSATATGVATTDVITFTSNATIKAVTGFVPATTGGLTINAYPTAGYVNFDVCNWTAGAVTPGAVTVNWRVVR